MTDLTSAPCVRAVEVPQACLAALGSSGGSAVASTGIADGYCDHVLNFEKCNWDGGDCCPSTCSCLADNDNDCDCAPSPCEDEDGFSCKDPLLAVDCTLAKADGWCDPDCNGHARDWDGGDCCETTCLTGLAKAYACGSHGAYECLDPTAGDGAGSFDFVGTTVPTNSTYVPYWWEDLGPSIALSFFVAAVASTLLMLGVYFYLLTPRLRHAHCLARLVAWLVTTGLTAGGCALFAGGIVFVSPSFVAGISCSVSLVLNFLFALCFHTPKPAGGIVRTVLVVVIIVAAIGLIVPLDKLSFWETRSDLFASFLSTGCWLYISVANALAVVAGLFQVWVDKRMKLRLQDDPHDDDDAQAGGIERADVEVVFGDSDDDSDGDATAVDDSGIELREASGTPSSYSHRRGGSYDDPEDGAGAAQQEPLGVSTRNAFRLDNIPAFRNVFYVGLPMIAGIMGAQNMLISTELFRLQYALPEEDGSEFEYETWNYVVHIGLVIANLVTNGLEVTFLQRALEKYDTTVVLVLFQCCLVVCAFLGDYIMFGTFYSYTAAGLGIMGGSFLLLLGALVFFCVRRSPARQDFRNGHAFEANSHSFRPTTSATGSEELEFRPTAPTGAQMSHAQSRSHEDREHRFTDDDRATAVGGAGEEEPTSTRTHQPSTARIVIGAVSQTSRFDRELRASDNSSPRPTVTVVDMDSDDAGDSAGESSSNSDGAAKASTHQSRTVNTLDDGQGFSSSGTVSEDDSGGKRSDSSDDNLDEDDDVSVSDLNNYEADGGSTSSSDLDQFAM